MCWNKGKATENLCDEGSEEAVYLLVYQCDRITALVCLLGWCGGDEMNGMY